MSQVTLKRDTMGSAFSTADPTPACAASLEDLHEELLASVVGFLSARDVEAITVASKIIAYGVLPRFPIWKHLFCYRWNMLNFALKSDAADGTIAIEIDERVSAMFPSNCTESRIYQLLAHAVTPVPSFADVQQTTRVRHFSNADHVIEAINNPPRRRTLDIAYAGRMLGGDRCVRANVPFAPTFRVAVYAVANPDQSQSYRVGVVASGYFEISISAHKRQPSPNNRGIGRLRQLWRHLDSEMTAIGLATSAFPLIDRQPGWEGESIGFHGDDGHLFNRHNRGRPFSDPFGVGDTVGCGLRRDFRNAQSFIYFTHNGALIPTGGGQIQCAHGAWYPVVGLDSLDAIHFNFGQEPFACAGAGDALFAECEGQTDLLSSHMSWYDISDSDAESSSEGGSVDGSARSLSGASDSDDSDAMDGDFEMAFDELSDYYSGNSDEDLMEDLE